MISSVCSPCGSDPVLRVFQSRLRPSSSDTELQRGACAVWVRLWAVWRAACVPPQSVRAGAKRGLLRSSSAAATQTTTVNNNRRPADRTARHAAADTPTGLGHGKSSLRPPRSLPLQDRAACALSSRSRPLKLRCEAAAPPLACLRVGAAAREARGPERAPRARSGAADGAAILFQRQIRHR